MLYFQVVRLPIYTAGKLNEEISSNFRYIYAVFMIHTILFMIHTVQSPQLYILWPEDGLVQRPKHVASLNKGNNVRYLCFDSKELIFNHHCTIFVCHSCIHIQYLNLTSRVKFNSFFCSLCFGFGVLHRLGNQICPEWRSGSSSILISACCSSKSELKIVFSWGMGNTTNLGCMLETGKVIVCRNWKPHAYVSMRSLASLLFHFPMPWC